MPFAVAVRRLPRSVFCCSSSIFFEASALVQFCDRRWDVNWRKQSLLTQPPLQRGQLMHHKRLMMDRWSLQLTADQKPNQHRVWSIVTPMMDWVLGIQKVELNRSGFVRTAEPIRELWNLVAFHTLTHVLPPMSTSRFAHLCRSRPAAPFSPLPLRLYLTMLGAP